MSKRLEELFEIYLKLKSENNIFDKWIKEIPMFDIKINERFEIVKPNYEIGEVFIVDNFFFLLTSETDEHYVGFKMTEWVEFATHNDFVFDFADDAWMAITTELFIEKEKIKNFVGKLDENLIDILYDYVVEDEPFPSKNCGLTIPLDNLEYPQNKFRMNELEEVMQYCFAQFMINDKEEEVEKKLYTIEELREILKAKTNEIEMPLAAADTVKTAAGDNFYLHYDKSKNIFTIFITNEELAKSKIAKLQFFDAEYLFLIENSKITFEIEQDFVNISYLKDNIRIMNA